MRVYENVLRCYEHVRRVDANRLVKKIFDSECSNRRVVSKNKKKVPWFIWHYMTCHLC